ncbi:YpzG family protein [Falsibacillus albus]|uniref:YpzG family protein n=1 Tax=Falsibacillus albus TaxID=2478915 RepID=A0A3L7JQN4_9BACI|nr:YpzG family protein [Falsibacillus albus]RLQ92379.1 YpzG family protein [Falsibacillus albus]
MANMKNNFSDNKYSSPFAKGWYNPKHSYAQVNGETKLTQKHIILEHETRKRS